MQELASIFEGGPCLIETALQPDIACYLRDNPFCGNQVPMRLILMPRFGNGKQAMLAGCNTPFSKEEQKCNISNT